MRFGAMYSGSQGSAFAEAEFIVFVFREDLAKDKFDIHGCWSASHVVPLMSGGCTALQSGSQISPR